MAKLFKHSVEIDETALRFEPFTENLDVRSFSCGSKDLDEFLTTNEVIDYQRQKYGVTHLVYYKHELVAYFTISMDSLRREYVKRRKGSLVHKIDEIPALKIGRLAVDVNYQNKGLGRTLIKYIAGKALELGGSLGVRFLIVQAKPDAIEFYEKCGFELTKETRRERSRKSRTMFLDLDLLRD